MRVPALLALGVALLFARLAPAATVRVDFSGTIDVVAGDFGSLTGSFGVGTRFSGYFAFDDSTAPTVDDPEVLPDPDNGFSNTMAQATYFFTAPASAFHLELGDLSVDADVPNFFSPTGGYTIDVYDFELTPDPLDPSFVYLDATVGGIPGDPGTTVWLERVEMDLSGSEVGLPLHSTDLGAVPWSLLDFPSASVFLSFNESGGEFPWASGIIDALSVPEPGRAALLTFAALALFGLGIVRARYVQT